MKVLKQMGRLRCPQEVSGPAGVDASDVAWLLTTHLPPGTPGCGAPSLVSWATSTIMTLWKAACGGKPPSFPCTHCGKPLPPKAGHDYHVRSEHTASVSSHSLGARSSGPCPGWAPSSLLGDWCRGNESVMGACAPSLLSPVFSVWHMPCGSPAHPASPPQRPGGAL